MKNQVMHLETILKKSISTTIKKMKNQVMYLETIKKIAITIKKKSGHAFLNNKNSNNN